MNVDRNWLRHVAGLKDAMTTNDLNALCDCVKLMLAYIESLESAISHATGECARLKDQHDILTQRLSSQEQIAAALVALRDVLLAKLLGIPNRQQLREMFDDLLCQIEERLEESKAARKKKRSGKKKR